MDPVSGSADSFWVCIGENDPVDCFLVLQEISLELLVLKKIGWNF